VVTTEHLQYFQLSHPLEAEVGVYGTQIHLQHLKQEKMEETVVAEALTLLEAEFQEDQEIHLQQHPLKELEMEHQVLLLLLQITLEPEAAEEELLTMDQVPQVAVE
jgi:hypothetical protein